MAREYKLKPESPDKAAQVVSNALSLPTTRDIAALPGDALAEYMHQVSRVEKAAKMIKDECKRRLTEDGESVPGFFLKPGAQVRSVTNPAAAVEKLQGLLPNIYQIVELPLGRLEVEVMAAFHVDKATAKEWIDTNLAELIEVKVNAPSVKPRE